MTESNGLAEIPYPERFHLVHTPAQLGLIAAISGFEPPPCNSDFVYCEIGCGTGLTPTVLAQMNPDATFIGIDLDANHIAVANERKARAGLANLEFLCADICALDPDEFPACDYIAVHGVYGWVPDVVRAAIRTFVQRKLTANGLFYVSYNALPGWAAIAPLRSYMHALMNSMEEGSLTERVERALARLCDLSKGDFPFFAAVPMAERFLADMQSHDPAYVVHELLTPQWDPLAFADVFADMSAVGLGYVGDALLLENVEEHALLPAIYEEIQTVSDPLLRETTKDLLQNRFFRRDVYARNPPTIKPTALDEVLVTLVQPRATVSAKVDVAAGELNLEGDWFERVCDLLDGCVLSIGEVVGHANLSDIDPSQLRGGLVLLLGGGRLVRCARRESGANYPLEDPITTPMMLSLGWVPCPITGGGIGLGNLHCLIAESLLADEPLEWALDKLADRGIELSDDGEVIANANDIRAAMSDLLDEFSTTWQPTLRGLGILP